MRRRAVPPTMSAMSSDVRSAIEFTAFAPIASRTSTTRWTTTWIPVGRVDEAGDDVDAASAQLHEDGVDVVRRGDELVAAFEEAGLRGLRIRDVHHLHLRLHDRSGRGRVEASGGVGPTGRVTRRSDDRGLLRGHRDEHALAVDDEVGRKAHGHTQDADDVLDEHVRGIDRETASGSSACRSAASRPVLSTSPSRRCSGVRSLVPDQRDWVTVHLIR